MTRQKSLKRDVRSRMSKTGERYTAARRQVLERADRTAAAPEPAASEPAASEPAAPEPAPTKPAATVAPAPPAEMPSSEAALQRATGRGWDEWLSILDDWGAREKGHTETARWLVAEQGVSGWWSQSVTVGFERARGLRQKHQMRSGFEVDANKTVGVPVERLAQAITDPDWREAWLPGVALRERPSRAARLARFDWPDDGSVVTIHFVAKGDAKSVASVQHQRLADAGSAERMKAFWRARLEDLRKHLESAAT